MTSAVLILALEAGRYGPARLPEALSRAGVAVSALCPQGNALGWSSHLAACHPLPASRHAGRLLGALARAVAAENPSLLIPADEQAVALLHHALQRGGPLAGLVAHSLGRTDRLEAMLFKSHTLALARAQGVAVPQGGTAASGAAAVALARQVGFPAYVKRSFSWAGEGVISCADEPAVALAYARACRRPPAPYRWARALAGRGWYPQRGPVDVQQALAGRPAFYCALAWQGRMVGGFAGEALATQGASGPSTAVRLGAHPEMARASQTMIAALGATGWIGFDFLPGGDGRQVLIECNPRPIPVCHLGASVGVDLAAALAALLAGGEVPPAPLEATATREWQLFPHALLAPVGTIAPDLPLGDPGLMRFAQTLG